jgi:hypothetical protein
MNKSLSIVGSSRANGDRELNDFYPTPDYATQALLDREKFIGEIWEPACGEGHMSEVLIKNGYNVVSSDLIDRNYGQLGDFLTSNYQTQNIITNPPFKHALEFVNKAKQNSNGKIAMFLKTVFLESEKRYEMFNDTEYPLKTVYQFSKRVSLTKNGEKMKNSGMVAYAWYVWDKEYVGQPTLQWIK